MDENTPAVSKRALRMMNKDLMGVEQHCAVCSAPIPREAALKKKAVVCSQECREIRFRWFRQFKDEKICRHCRKPSTYTQRRAFARFEAWEVQHPDLAHPKTWHVLSQRGISLETFGKAVEEAREQDFSFEYTPLALRWTRFPKPNLSHENLDPCIAALASYWAEVEASKPVPSSNTDEHEEPQERPAEPAEVQA